jgi:hypothetical protein
MQRTNLNIECGNIMSYGLNIKTTISRNSDRMEQSEKFRTVIRRNSRRKARYIQMLQNKDIDLDKEII